MPAFFDTSIIPKKNLEVRIFAELLALFTEICCIVAVGIGWWFLRSYIVLDGDILGLQTRKEMSIKYAVDTLNPLTAQTYQKMKYSVWEMIRECDTINVAFCSFIATDGSMSIPGPINLYRVYKLFFGAGGVGLFCALCNWRNYIRVGWKKFFFHLNMFFCIIMPLALMLYYSYTIDYQPQGRYVLPSLVPLMYYVVKGIEKLVGIRWKQFKLPRSCVNFVVLTCLLIILSGTFYMIYFCAMPIYLQTGVVLT